MRRFLSRARGPSLATLLVSALGACNGDPPTQPAGALLAPLGAGRAVTVIAENDAPLWFARLRPDSAALLPVRLGDVRLRGAAGDSEYSDCRLVAGSSRQSARTPAWWWRLTGKPRRMHSPASRTARLCTGSPNPARCGSAIQCRGMSPPACRVASSG